MILEDHEMQKLHIPSLQELLNYENVDSYPFERTFEEEKQNPIFVLHTSGSTGNENDPLGLLM
jgi:acyl-coenzyme A synthetase/AMP-(fatty) acid ligase